MYSVSWEGFGGTSVDIGNSANLYLTFHSAETMPLFLKCLFWNWVTSQTSFFLLPPFSVVVSVKVCFKAV